MDGARIALIPLCKNEYIDEEDGDFTIPTSQFSSSLPPMQRPDEKKRRDIMKIAEAAFAARPFHEVRLEEIAARARIGKGTIYIYFRSKENLLVEILREGLGDLQASIERRLLQCPDESVAKLRAIVTELATFAISRPYMYSLVRSVLPRSCETGLSGIHKGIVKKIVEVIEKGVERGDFADTHPALTAHYLLGAVRGVAISGPGKLSAEEFAEHLMVVFGRGLCAREGASR